MKPALILLLALISCKTYAQGLQRLYNFCPDTALASSNSAQYAEDSFFIAGGQAQTNGGTQLSSYLAVFDYKLHLLRKKYLYFPGIYNRLWGGNNAIIKTGSDKYVLLGFEDAIDTSTRVKEIYRPYLYIFNRNLDSLGFSKEDDTLVNKCPYSLTRDKEGNILVSGLITSASLHYNTWDARWYPDSSYVWVAKYDSNAHPIWSRQYFGHDNSDNIGYKIILSHDSASYILTGICENKASRQWENFFAKLDTAGNVIWQSFLPKEYLSYNDIDIIALRNGEYGFVTSYSDTTPLVYMSSTYIIRSAFYYGKFNEIGDTLWTKYTTDSLLQQGEKIVEASNGDLILLGTSYYGGYYPSLFRADSTGKIKLYRDYMYVPNTLVSSQLGFVSVTPSDQLLLSGAVGASVARPGIFDSVGSLSWFVLTDTFDCISGGCEAGDSVWQKTDTTNSVNIVNHLVDINLYPNPAQQQLYIQTGAVPDNSEAELMDISGRRLYRLKLKANTKEQIDVGSLEPGLYLLQVWVNGVMVKTYKVSKVE